MAPKFHSSLNAFENDGRFKFHCSGALFRYYLCKCLLDANIAYSFDVLSFFNLMDHGSKSPNCKDKRRDRVNSLRAKRNASEGTIA